MQKIQEQIISFNKLFFKSITKYCNLYLVLNIYAIPKAVSGTVLENDDLKIIVSFKNSDCVKKML